MPRRSKKDILDEEIKALEEKQRKVIEKLNNFSPASPLGLALKDMIYIYDILGSDIDFIKDQFECYTGEMFGAELLRNKS